VAIESSPKEKLSLKSLPKGTVIDIDALKMMHDVMEQACLV
jgi:hypothetical protein